MQNSFNIAVFHGDGIGPEIMEPTLDLLAHVAGDAYALQFVDAPAGAAHYAKTGESLPRASMETARAADAILLSAMGLPDVRYPDGTEISP
ncbi:MAG: isocitrate/isopropylmalate family dehydrogenase, partial [Pseudomonadota bacterium]